jgi:hypothetical protein
MTLPWFGIHLARERLNKSHLHRAVSLAETFDATGAVGKKGDRFILLR